MNSKTQKTKRSPWPATLTATFLTAFGVAMFKSEDGGVFRSEPYYDSVGVLTACGGLTNAATRPIGHVIVEGAVYTDALCQDLFNRIAARFNDELRQCVSAPIAPHEHFAYMHFAWNIGTPAFCRSTLVKKLNAEDYDGACDQLLVWFRAGGRDCRIRQNNCYGVWVRRNLEHAMCTLQVDISVLFSTAEEEDGRAVDLTPEQSCRELPINCLGYW